MTDPITTLAWACVACAAIPAATFVWNLRLYRPPTSLPLSSPRPVPLSVLIPARNEERSIGSCVESVLASRAVDLEVIVLDDRSEDRTAAVVEGIAARDGRVRLEQAPPLPAGWCGKQHACWILSTFASNDRIAFLDADVRLDPDALALTAGEFDRRGLDLLSGFPAEETGTLAEKLVIPLIHFVLLGFLPLDQSRKRKGPEWAAGCGQFFLTDKAAYDRAGGHAAIRRSLHDGIKMPRAYRRAGLKTDLVDLTGLARCRMYRDASEVWNGFAKNAHEGFAAPALIAPITAVLLLGQILPPLLTAAAVLGLIAPSSAGLFGLATGLAYLPRLIAVSRFRQSPTGAALHPIGVALFLAIQWAAFARTLSGRPAQWKGRPYAAVGAGPAVQPAGCSVPAYRSELSGSSR